MNENQIADIRLLFKEYLDKKTLEIVVDNFFLVKLKGLYYFFPS